jgi:hypothetical protein
VLLSTPPLILTIIQVVLTLQDESPVCGIPYMKVISLTVIMGGGYLMDLSGFIMALENGKTPVAANQEALMSKDEFD